MDEIQAYTFAGLDLRAKVILDAATGAGESTAAWAAAIAGRGGTSRIISIDNDMSEAWRERALDRLGDHRHLVELRDGDIFDMRGIEDASIDIVNCHDTLVFLGTVPLRVLGALEEYRRVLKPGGLLIVTSETSTPTPPAPEAEGQWRRWNLAKAIHALKGEVWATEIGAAELERALVSLGFDQLETRIFEPQRTTSMDSITEWREIMLEDVAALPWDEPLKAAIEEQVEKVAEKVLADGFLMIPARFVTKARKGATPR